MSTLSLARNDLVKPLASWRASLQLKFARRNNKTVPYYAKHCGPLRVQRPFYPETDTICHSYVLHPPGGVVGGDNLHLQVEVEETAHALVTTPGASKIYRNNLSCEIHNDLVLGDEAVLEWLPQETIVFNSSSSCLLTRIRLAATSHLFFWDVTCLGMPATGERYCHGSFKQDLVIELDNRTILLEKNALRGGDSLQQSSWGWQNRYVSAFVIFSGAQNIDLEMLRELSTSHSDLVCGFTTKKGFVICRVLADDVEKVKKLFIDIWCVWRESTLHINAVKPRIWNT